MLDEADELRFTCSGGCPVPSQASHSTFIAAASGFPFFMPRRPQPIRAMG